MTTIYTTAQRDYPYYGVKSYRIEKKQTEHGWMQRHIWTYVNGDVVTDKWIRSICSADEPWYTRVQEDVA